VTESAPRPILHGSNISPYVRKVRVALAFKGIEYDDVQQIPFGAPPEFVAKSPLSKIPCWEEGELILPDSSVVRRSRTRIAPSHPSFEQLLKNPRARSALAYRGSQQLGLVSST
jgi:hypothetical protein